MYHQCLRHFTATYQTNVEVFQSRSKCLSECCVPGVSPQPICVRYLFILVARLGLSAHLIAKFSRIGKWPAELEPSSHALGLTNKSKTCPIGMLRCSAVSHLSQHLPWESGGET